MTRKCECSDNECPHVTHGHHGRRRLMFRVDMEDKTGTLMCETCRNDAFTSGLFRD